MAGVACKGLSGRSALCLSRQRLAHGTRRAQMRSVALPPIKAAMGWGGASPHTSSSPVPAPVPVSQLKLHLRMHRQRLEHLLTTGAASAAELQPLVHDLRQITNMVAAAGAWDRLRSQVQALERALAAAGATTSSTSTSSSSSMALAATSTAAAALTTPLPPFTQQQQRLTRPGQLAVCTGKKCAAQGALCTLAAAQLAAAGSPVEVVASKCMGKCGKGPCVRARAAGREGSALSRNVDAAAAPALLRQHFGEALPPPPSSPLPPPAV